MEYRHLYKVFRNGAYLGLLPYVISEFEYGQDINTVATQTNVTIMQPLDIAGEPVEPLETEDGQTLTTESDITLTTESAVPIIGDKDSGLIVADGNDIQIWEYSDNDINGVLVFSGYQSRMKAGLNAGTVELTIISDGIDLNNYIYGNASYNLQTSQTSANGYFPIIPLSPPSSVPLRYWSQTISGLSYVLSKVQISLGVGSQDFGVYPSTTTVNMQIVNDSDLVLATSSAVVTNVSPSYQYINFILSNSVALDPSQTYAIVISSTDYAEFQLSTANPFADGNLYSSSDGVTYYSSPGYDIVFKLYSGGLATDAVFTSTDTSDMVREVLDGYGGGITYTLPSIDDTGYSLDYTWSLATPAEIIAKAREMSPANYYYYVPPNERVLYFKETPTTATHKFILGRHIHDFDYESTIEYIKNVTYFTGGPTAGTNLLKKYSDVASLVSNRIGMERLSDNRIVAANEPAAAAISYSYMDENSDQVHTANPIVIHADSYDIKTIHLGDTASVIGQANYVDSVVFQITSIRRMADKVALTFGRLPLRSSAYVDELKQKLDKQQTLDNPDTPS